MDAGFVLAEVNAQRNRESYAKYPALVRLLALRERLGQESGAATLDDVLNVVDIILELEGVPAKTDSARRQYATLLSERMF